MDTAEAIQSLSDKEREALRLLLEGHDAKSSAQKLGVSHHTIHDRLSRARRKLGTTGSREAALLVKSHENRTRESFVHETIGCAPAAKLPEKFFGAQLKRPASPGSHGRRKGLIIMAISAMFVAAVTALNFQVDSPQATRDITIDPAPLKTAAETDARRAQAAPRSIVATREFLALVDSGDAAGGAVSPTTTRLRWAQIGQGTQSLSGERLPLSQGS
jgi:DNA-binding CsgD family transcriptional regulator